MTDRIELTQEEIDDAVEKHATIIRQVKMFYELEEYDLRGEGRRLSEEEKKELINIFRKENIDLGIKILKKVIRKLQDSQTVRFK